MPNLTDLHTHTLDAESTAWLVHVLEVIETLDADAYAALMTEDVRLRLPTGTVLEGRAAVAGALRGAWTSVRALEHHELGISGDAHVLVHESRVVTTTTQGQTTTAMSTAWIERDDQGRITTARVYG